jgi:hypothetical protein
MLTLKRLNFAVDLLHRLDCRKKTRIFIYGGDRGHALGDRLLRCEHGRPGCSKRSSRVMASLAKFVPLSFERRHRFLRLRLTLKSYRFQVCRANDGFDELMRDLQFRFGSRAINPNVFQDHLKVVPIRLNTYAIEIGGLHGLL